MNITRNNIDSLNAVVTVSVTKEDYAPKVEKTLKDYRKNANVPGFRKGAVPMSLIQKQYGKSIMFEEVNKILQEQLNEYITNEKLDILGNPLPKPMDTLDWDAETLQFEFELGMVPEFEVNLEAKNNLVSYKIIADDKMLDEQVARLQKQYGKVTPAEVVDADSEITVTFSNEEHNINNKTTISLDVFSDVKAAKSFVGKKVGEVVVVQTKGLFNDDHKLMDYLKVDHDVVHGLGIEVNVEINDVFSTEKAPLDQEFFDKLFGPESVSSEAEMRTKLKEIAESQFVQQSEQKFLNDVTEFLLENTRFDLPSEFLIKWLQQSGEKPLTAKEASDEFSKSEKGLRYQLIEGKIMKDHNLQITFEDLKDHTSVLIKNQMAQFGQLNPSDEEINNIVARVLSNQDEVRRLSEQLMSAKMLQLFKDKVNAKQKEVNMDDFVKVFYGE